VFVTGHLRDNSINLDWEGIVRPDQTIVIYMGLHGLDILCKELVAHGLSSRMPAAIVQQGTTKHQKVVTGTLETLPRARGRAPACAHPHHCRQRGEAARLAWFNPNTPTSPGLSWLAPGLRRYPGSIERKRIPTRFRTG
jgi:uroporphyrin-III C-methyltransferase/precorrin-2 dehydrogenase/sirohydrochlorin ferrochelatase